MVVERVSATYPAAPCPEGILSATRPGAILTSYDVHLLTHTDKWFQRLKRQEETLRNKPLPTREEMARAWKKVVEAYWVWASLDVQGDHQREDLKDIHAQMRRRIIYLRETATRKLLHRIRAKMGPRFAKAAAPELPKRTSHAQIVRGPSSFANFDYHVAAKVLGLMPNVLRRRCEKSQQLSALLAKDPKVPTALTTLIRQPPKLEDRQDDLLGEQMVRQNRELLRSGLEKAGIKPATIEKLRQFDEFASNAGDFLVASLDLTHRTMIYLMVHLLEEAERIKSDYLDDATLDDEYKIQWQSAYTDIVEQIGKCYDRTLLGTQAMARMLGTENVDKGKKKKAGFTPLKRAEKVLANAGQAPSPRL